MLLLTPIYSILTQVLSGFISYDGMIMVQGQMQERSGMAQWCVFPLWRSEAVLTFKVIYVYVRSDAWVLSQCEL